MDIMNWLNPHYTTNFFQGMDCILLHNYHSAKGRSHSNYLYFLFLGKLKSRFFESLEKAKIDLKNRVARGIGGGGVVKLQCLTVERETSFGSSSVSGD